MLTTEADMVLDAIRKVSWIQKAIAAELKLRDSEVRLATNEIYEILQCPEETTHPIIFREGDYVEVKNNPHYEGCQGRVAPKFPPGELDPKWVPVLLDGKIGVYVFLEHELTRCRQVL